MQRGAPRPLDTDLPTWLAWVVGTRPPPPRTARVFVAVLVAEQPEHEAEERIAPTEVPPCRASLLGVPGAEHDDQDHGPEDDDQNNRYRYDDRAHPEHYGRGFRLPCKAARLLFVQSSSSAPRQGVDARLRFVSSVPVRGLLSACSFRAP